MKIKEIKNIIEDAKECGCLATITLANGQVSHVNFSKNIKKFTITSDVILDEDWQLLTDEQLQKVQPEQPSVPQSPAIICPHCGKPIELEIKAKEGK